MEKYFLVYNFFETPNDFGTKAMLIAFIGIAALLYAIFRVQRQKKISIISLSIFCLFSISWNVILQFGDYNSYNKIEEFYKQGKVKTVEGFVSDYSPMNIGDHDSNETFMVDSVAFSYSDYMPIDGYNNTCVKGGVICENGQVIKIEYIQKYCLIVGVPTSVYVANITGNQIIKLHLKK